jgi:hypothetical protein
MRKSNQEYDVLAALAMNRPNPTALVNEIFSTMLEKKCIAHTWQCVDSAYRFL